MATTFPQVNAVVHRSSAHLEQCCGHRHDLIELAFHHQPGVLTTPPLIESRHRLAFITLFAF
jgi:hypothetical protein